MDSTSRTPTTKQASFLYLNHSLLSTFMYSLLSILFTMLQLVPSEHSLQHGFVTKCPTHYMVVKLDLHAFHNTLLAQKQQTDSIKGTLSTSLRNEDPAPALHQYYQCKNVKTAAKTQANDGDCQHRTSPLHQPTDMHTTIVISNMLTNQRHQQVDNKLKNPQKTQHLTRPLPSSRHNQKHQQQVTEEGRHKKLPSESTIVHSTQA
ncbi:hypothetical protein M758_UG171100 [Ceratodon purpureus]|nr:hypothetical protein M758_UG171100 [Ceratodon purpureus]